MKQPAAAPSAGGPASVGLWEGGCGPVTHRFGGHGFQMMFQIHD
jgi:hypothetical protein